MDEVLYSMMGKVYVFEAKQVFQPEIPYFDINHVFHSSKAAFGGFVLPRGIPSVMPHPPIERIEDEQTQSSQHASSFLINPHRRTPSSAHVSNANGTTALAASFSALRGGPNVFAQ